MKTLLLTEGAQGQARSYLAKRMLESVVAKQDIALVEAAQDAELIVVIGDEQPQDATLNGKRLFVGSAEKAIREPEAFLAQAKAEAQPYQFANAAVAAPAKGQMRVVAVTACPTGVAHTFMAAEAIEAEAKKRGWWVKVETRGSVGAGNEIT
ncbi:MAG: fructose PTS transporter subunit IIB, partial [Enterobacterales bacterium]|nr:fructose PTS transporter subunit IIB [Enterobacterales bacterium]